MIRWRYLLPRLALLGTLLILVCLGLDPIVRWFLLSAGQSLTGARVEIGSLDTAPLATDIVLDDLRVADPRDPMKNLFEVDRMALDLDPAALLRRKLIVDSARVDGLRLGTTRESSGELPEGSDTRLTGLPRFRLPQLDQAWLKRGTDLVWKEVQRESESIRLLRSLADRWPAELERLRVRAVALAERVRGLQHTLEVDDNVLRRMEQIHEATAQLQEIAQQAVSIDKELRRIGRRAAADRQALVRAQARDRQRLEELVRLDPLRPAMLSEYLLGAEVHRKVTALVEWVNWAQSLSSSRDPGPTPVRQRGVDVAFDSPNPLPDFLVRGATFSGEGELFGRAAQFRGTAWGFTTQPKLYGGPMLVKMETTGGVEMHLDMGIDHTGPIARQRIVVACPRLRHDELALGNAEQLVVGVAPGTARLDVRLDVEGDCLSGRVRIEQDATLVEARLASDYVNPCLARRLQTALSAVDRLSATVHVSGTVESPRWQIDSDLGHQLAEGLQRALREELEVRRGELAGQLEARVGKQLAGYEQIMSAGHQHVVDQLKLGDTELRHVRALVAQRIHPLQPGLPTKAINQLLRR